MNLPLTIGKNSSNEDFVVDIEQLPHLFVSYNDEAQIQRLFSSLLSALCSSQRSLVSFALASTKPYSVEPSGVKQKAAVKYYHRSGAVWNSMEGSREKFMFSLSREMRLRTCILHRQTNKLRTEKQFPTMIILLHDVFDIILSRKKSAGMIFLKLLLMGKELGMHVVAASCSTYRNLLKQLAQINPLVMDKFRGRLGACDFRMSTSLGAELVMTAEDFVFFKEANSADYHRLYPATDIQTSKSKWTEHAILEPSSITSPIMTTSVL